MTNAHLSAAEALVAMGPRLGRLITVTLEASEGGHLSLRQYRLLERLESRPHRPAELVSSSDVSQSTISAALASLEVRGLVARAPDPDDRRAVLCRLTSSGARVLVGCRRDLEEVLHEAVRELSEEDARHLGRIAPEVTQGIRRARKWLRSRRDD